MDESSFLPDRNVPIAEQAPQSDPAPRSPEEAEQYRKNMAEAISALGHSHTRNAMFYFSDAGEVGLVMDAFACGLGQCVKEIREAQESSEERRAAVNAVKTCVSDWPRHISAGYIVHIMDEPSLRGPEHTRLHEMGRALTWLSAATRKANNTYGAYKRTADDYEALGMADKQMEMEERIAGGEENFQVDEEESKRNWTEVEEALAKWDELTRDYPETSLEEVARKAQEKLDALGSPEMSTL